jgi:hypothetical protein
MSRRPLRILEADLIRCPMCRLPWSDHPLIEGTQEPYCRNVLLTSLPPPTHRHRDGMPTPKGSAVLNEPTLPGERITPPGGPFWTERGRWP